MVEKPVTSATLPRREVLQAYQPFTMRIQASQTGEFAALLQSNGLYRVIQRPDATLKRAAITHRTDQLYTPIQQSLLTELADVRQHMLSQQRISEETPFTYRHVQAELPEIDRVLAQSLTTGGKRPDNPSDGICVGVYDYKILGDFVFPALQRGVSSLLFVYDDSLLRRVTDEESRLDPSGDLNPIWGKMPIAGLPLRDTLLGAVVMENNAFLTIPHNWP